MISPWHAEVPEDELREERQVEAEEDDRAEEEKKQIGTAEAPQVDTVSDEKLLEELRRRAEAKQVN